MDERKKNERNELFGELIKPLNHFFHEKPVKGFLQQMDELFKTTFSFAPSFNVEVSETEHGYLISSELPGIKREQIDIDIVDRYVTISIHSSESLTQEDENQKTVRRQESLQRSSRTIPLPQPINEREVKASYKDGLLQILVPKQKGKKIILDDPK
ncbi:Hsp20 family protein [Bacillus sp. V3B]|uniref:Hsp20/alpha crystallin family protein n=1 Tax=Bacillus sp. V3B TaxID=2804915 RepID=UPI002108BBE2|nr:Hsp20 family protein [Bacillus sp. V3B]MCQ6277151.1 Hsp20 family protein [Bacillus sp. V3B]